MRIVMARVIHWDYAPSTKKWKIAFMASHRAATAGKQPARTRMINIARAAGVSRAAVSCVLTGGKTGNVRLSDETAARIRQIAQELRFHPNHVAQQLAGKRSGIIGALAQTWARPTESRSPGMDESIGLQSGVQGSRLANGRFARFPRSGH